VVKWRLFPSLLNRALPDATCTLGWCGVSGVLVAGIRVYQPRVDRIDGDPSSAENLLIVGFVAPIPLPESLVSR
jgi:hypothetical protein